MAHAYTQTSVTKVGDQVTVVGTVDDTPVTITFWASAVIDMSTDERVTYVASLMLAALPSEPEDLTSLYPSTVTL